MAVVNAKTVISTATHNEISDKLTSLATELLYSSHHLLQNLADLRNDPVLGVATFIGVDWHCNLWYMVWVSRV